jgi:pimeloyl-ACP methyl ester carboxylesterase
MPEYRVADGTWLAYDVSGKPAHPALLLLHGDGQDRSTWRGVAAALDGDHRVYCLDLRGHDDGGRDDVLYFARALGVDRVGVIGQSPVTWRIAQAAPDLVDRLVVEDAVPPDPDAVPDIKASALVLSGGYEWAPGLREAATMLPSAELVTIAVGHHIHRDAESTFVKVVSAFLAATRAS